VIPKHHTLQVTGIILFKHFTKLAVQYETEVNDDNLKVQIIVVICSGDRQQSSPCVEHGFTSKTRDIVHLEHNDQYFT